MREYEGSTAYKVTEKLFGTRLQLVDRTITLGATVTEILPNNPRRVGWVIVNRDISPIAIGFNRQITYDTGIIIGSNGGTATMHVTEDGECTSYSVYGLSATGLAPVYVVEVIGL